MPRERLPIRKIGNVPRLRAGGLSKRRIAVSLNIGRSPVRDCPSRRFLGQLWGFIDDDNDLAPGITPYRPTGRHSARSATTSGASGCDRSGGAAKRIALIGGGRTSWLTTGSPNHESFTLGPTCGSPPDTRGRSRMRESRSYGSVRGALRNERPYRESPAPQPTPSAPPPATDI